METIAIFALPFVTFGAVALYCVQQYREVSQR